MTQAEPIRTLLESQHRVIDERFERLAAQLGQGEVEAAPFDEAIRALQRHIYLEEELLFPEVEARGLTGPTGQMVREHGEIWGLLSAIEDGIASDARPARLQDLLGAVVSRLREHNAKEEQVLYPASDKLLNAADRAQLVERMEAAQVPGGWTCRAHGSGPAARA